MKTGTLEREIKVLEKSLDKARAKLIAMKSQTKEEVKNVNTMPEV